MNAAYINPLARASAHATVAVALRLMGRHVEAARGNRHIKEAMKARVEAMALRHMRASVLLVAPALKAGTPFAPPDPEEVRRAFGPMVKAASRRIREVNI